MNIISLIVLGMASVLTIGFYKKIAVKAKLLDHPNERSSHLIPTPRGAGLVFISLWLLFLVALYVQGFSSLQNIQVFAPLVLLLFFGFLDDYYTISAKLRFVVQIIAALLSLWLIGGITEWNLGFVSFDFGIVFGTVLALLMFLWSVNLFNFMDGIDGIAAIEALFVLIPGSIWIFLKGGFELGFVMWGLCAVILGFLFWNAPKAKVFMGDSGSLCLGFLIILFALIAQKSFDISLLSWMVLYGLFLFDATFTLARRVLKKEKWFQAHRLHAYQRLHQAGWPQSRVLLAVIIINSALTLIASVMNFYPQFSLIGFLLAVIILAASYGYVERLQPMYKIIVKLGVRANS